MTGLGQILGQVLEILTDLIPRPVYVPRCQRGAVWFLWWGPWSVYGPLIVWPICMELETIDVREDATVFEPTVLWTKDGREVAVGAVLTWAVGDAKVALDTVNDITSFVGEKLESVLPTLVGQYDLEELQRKAAGGEGREWALNRHLLSATVALLEPYGIRVIDARVNFTSRARVFRLLQS